MLAKNVHFNKFFVKKKIFLNKCSCVAKLYYNTNKKVIVHGLTRSAVHPPPPINKTVFFWQFFMCFLILDMLTLNKLLRITGFELLDLLYQQKFFPILGGTKSMNGNIFVVKYHKHTSDHSKC